MTKNDGYAVQGFYYHIDAYVEPSNIEEWCECPHCKLKPHVWVFDNGEYTACGCWNNMYAHFTIQAPSVLSIYVLTNSTAEYSRDTLRNNWNHWCNTGEVLYVRP